MVKQIVMALFFMAMAIPQANAFSEGDSQTLIEKKSCAKPTAPTPT